MRVYSKVWLWAIGMVLLMSQMSFAAGFGIYEWSARSNALGGATVGRADDPSAVASNPAGITQLDGVQVMGGFTMIHPVMDIQTVDPVSGKETWSTSDKNALWVPPHFYATWKVNDRYSLGLGVFSRFGLGSVIDEDWPGKYNSYEAIIESVSVNPNVAVKVTDKLSAAVGLEAMYLTFSQKRKLPFATYGQPDGDLHLDADGVSLGFNMALHYQPCDYAKIGLTYRSPVNMKVRGDATFSDIPGFIQTTGAFLDTSASGTVTLPDSFALGLALYPMDRLSIELGAVYTLWSKYDELTINFSDPVIPTSSGLVDTTTSSKRWRDVWRFNVGVEYAALDWLDLRLGYVFDQSPVRDHTIDYMVPANDRHLLNGGLGFHWDNWIVDLNYTYLKIMDRNIKGRDDGVLKGKIRNADAHMVGMSVGYRF